MRLNELNHVKIKVEGLEPNEVSCAGDSPPPQILEAAIYIMELNQLQVITLRVVPNYLFNSEYFIQNIFLINISDCKKRNKYKSYLPIYDIYIITLQPLIRGLLCGGKLVYNK